MRRVLGRISLAHSPWMRKLLRTGMTSQITTLVVASILTLPLLTYGQTCNPAAAGQCIQVITEGLGGDLNEQQIKQMCSDAPASVYPCLNALSGCDLVSQASRDFLGFMCSDNFLEALIRQKPCIKSVDTRKLENCSSPEIFSGLIAGNSTTELCSIIKSTRECFAGVLLSKCGLEAAQIFDGINAYSMKLTYSLGGQDLPCITSPISISAASQLRVLGHPSIIILSIGAYILVKLMA